MLNNRMFGRLNTTQKHLLVLALGLEIVALLLYGAVYKLFAKISPSDDVLAAEAPCQYAASAANPVAVENTCPGTDGWRPDLPSGSQQAIEAFTAPISVNERSCVPAFHLQLA